MADLNDYSTSTLVSNVQLIGHLPLSNSTFTATEIITLADRILKTSILKQLLSVHQGYYLIYSEYDTNADGLYPIPSGASAVAVENIEIVQAPAIIQVNLVEESEQFATNAPTTTSYGAFIRGNDIQILPFPQYGKVRVWFSRRPSVLIPVLSAGRITAINGAIYTLSSVPDTFLVDQSVDSIQAQPNFALYGTEIITDVTGNDVTLANAVDELVVGDYLAPENQTPIPQVPVEFRPLLEQRVVVKIYELQGYLEKKKAAMEDLKELESDMFSLIGPRIKSQTKIINPQNGGFLGGSNRFGRFPVGSTNGNP